MNDIAQIIIAVATLVTALGTIVLGLVNRHTINVVREQTNGMMIGLKANAHREGLVQGKAEGKAEEIQYQRDQKPSD